MLLHTCCVHCAAFTVDYWQSQGFEVTLFWYNPNIHPYLEHQRRLEALGTFVNLKGLSIMVIPSYDVVKFFQAVAGHEGERCQRCFYLRLKATAETAKKNNFAAFTTTLLISPYQKHQGIKEVGEMVAAETEIPFFYQDLRKYYSESRRRTKELNFYRQQYCGCLYSEWERYSKTS